ncbi:probable terpene synthase 11 isoform X2 [Hevea brasiliensis]|uniref:probable terpene synthase 11 isoform X2 n=1 Tax=Hevea brasiliensis TaxID=3981 RepID=UPI0025DF1B62|nr:probable terpene synthase 11 isoform X2 [Hevea brasiliensis]
MSSSSRATKRSKNLIPMSNMIGTRSISTCLQMPAAPNSPFRVSWQACSTQTSFSFCISPRCQLSLVPHPTPKDNNCTRTFEELRERTRKELLTPANPSASLKFIDSIQRLGIGYHFEEEINMLLERFVDWNAGQDLLATALRFRLLRHNGFPACSDVFNKFKDKDGKFNQSLSKDPLGLLSLYEASYLGTEEEVELVQAMEFTRTHLQKISIPLFSPQDRCQVFQALEIPRHLRMSRLETRNYINEYSMESNRKPTLLDLAKLDFNAVQLVHQKELVEIIRWDLSAMEPLPEYMKICYMALYNTTNDIAYMVLKQHGWSIVPHLKRTWIDMFEAFLAEAKWFNNEYVPSLEEYLVNGVTTGGTYMALVHAFFLMGQGVTKQTVAMMEPYPDLFSFAGKILRLWDDLGTAREEQERGDVASSIQCFMREKGISCEDEGRKQVRQLIRSLWIDLNGELVAPSSMPLSIINASFNLARTAQVVYQHGDDKKGSSVDDQVQALIYKPISLGDMKQDCV